MPPVIIAAVKGKIIWIPQTPVVRPDGRSEIGDGLAQSNDYGIRLGWRGIVAKCPSAKIIVAARAIGEFNLCRSGNRSDLIGKILKIMPDHEGRVVWIGPGAEFGHGQVIGFESPFDCPAENDIGIHSWRETAVAHQGLQLRTINEPALAIFLNQQIRRKVAVRQDGCADGVYAPNVVRRKIIMCGRNPPGDLLGFRRNSPREFSARNMADKPMLLPYFLTSK